MRQQIESSRVAFVSAMCKDTQRLQVNCDNGVKDLGIC